MKLSQSPLAGVGLVGILLGLVLTGVSNDPPRYDSDGDGSPDAAEYFLGTNPSDRQSVFAIRELVRLQGPSRTRLAWPSVAGKPYRIEASPSLTNPAEWQPVGTVTGTGGNMTFEVPDGGGRAKFIRVVTPYDSALPPWVGSPSVPSGAVTTPGFTNLELEAWHPNGVDNVVFRRGERVLGEAVPIGNNRWRFQWPADPTENGTEPITGEARSGNTLTVSQAIALEVNITLPPQPAYLTQNPDQFILLDAQGKPYGGAPVRADALGNLPPCEFRPSGFSVNGALAAVRIRLPQGARITGPAGSQSLEFSQSKLISAAGTPLEIPGTHETAGARTLPLGSVTVAQLLSLYNLPAGDGLPIRIAGSFPARLLAGTFGPGGLDAPQIRIDPGVLPFGETLGAFNGLTVELDEKGFVRLPISGAFPLGQAGGAPATLTIGAGNPAWIQFGFDGSLTLSGKGSLAFANGPSFEVGLTLDDPYAAFEFRVARMHAQISGGWLAANLPPAQSLTTATTADTATLNAASKALKEKSNAFERFARSFAAAAASAVPRPDGGRLPSPLEVISLGKLAGAAGLNASAPELKTAIQHEARAAAVARNAAEAAQRWLALERLRLGGLTPPELTDARAESRAALKRKLETASTPLSLDDVRNVLAAAVERMQVAQSVGAAFDHDGLQASFEQAIVAALANHAGSLGVPAGATQQASLAMQARDRFVIYQDLTELLAIWRDAQMLGLNIPPGALLTELFAQSGLALEPKLRAALMAAEIAGDEMAFLDAMAEYLFLRQMSDQGVFGTAPVSLLTVDSLAQRAGVMATIVENLPRPARAVAKRFREVKRLGEILAAIPAGVTYPAPPVQRAYDGLNDSISVAISLLSTANRAELLAILRAGNAGVFIRDRMALTPPSPAWEAPSRISAVVDALAAKCIAEDDPTTAFTGAESLFETAGRLTAPADQERRKIYLIEAQKLIAALRTIATARVTPPPAADALLSGGIAVDEIAGALAYNHQTEELNGWASGRVRLPGMGASLTLSRATFSTGGAFDLNCHGTVTLPPGAGGTARFSVTERRPLKFAWKRPNDFAVSGGGRLEVNGMTFEAWATLDDPEYAFGASASGLHFDLANSLRIMVPEFPTAPNFAPAVRRDLLEYVNNMAGNLDGLRSDLNPPNFREPGEMPEFDFGKDFGPFGWIEATVDQVIANHLVGSLGRDYSSAIQKVVRSINTLEGQLLARGAQDDCDSEAAMDDMRTTLRVLKKIEKAVNADPTGPGMVALAQRTIQLRQALAPRIACIVQYRASDDVEMEAKRIAFLLEFGAGTPDVDEAAGTVANSLEQRLLKLGIDPATGNPIGGAPLGSRDTRKAIIAVLNMMQYSNVLSQTGRDGEVVGHPGSNVGVVLGNATTALARTPWDGLVMEGRAILAKNAEIQAAVAASGAPGFVFPAGHPLIQESRELGTRLREWTANMTEYGLMLQFTGAMPPQGNVPHVVGPDGPFTTPIEEVNTVLAQVFLRETDQATPSRYFPVITIVKRDLGYGLLDYRSQPLIEGFQLTDVPYGSPAGKRRPLIDLSDQQWIYQSVQPPAAAPPEKHEEWRRLVQAANGFASAMPPLSADSLIAMADQLRLEIRTYLLAPALTPALKLARETRNVMIMARQAGLNAIVEDLKIPLGELDAAFKVLVTARKAWWHLSEYTSIFVEGSLDFADQTAGSLGRYFGTQAESSLGLGFQLIDDLALLLPTARPLDLALPGDLRIDEVFGEVRYNHSLGTLSGRFGGSLAFPDIDARFAINSLTLDNSGNVAISASAAGPLPGGNGVRLDGTLSLSGRFGLGSAGQPPMVLDQFSTAGTGTVMLPDGKVFQGTFGYDTATRVLGVTASGANLDYNLGDHFALLSGTIGLRFGGVGAGAFPSSGRIDLGGTFGLMRKSSPPAGQFLTPTHFHLSAVDAIARLEITTNSISVSLPQGRLLLPEMFQSPPVPPASTPTRAEIAINPTLPPGIVFALGAPDGNGLRPINQVTFSGGVTFTNLGLAIPDFEEVGARNFTGSLDFGNLSIGALGTIPAATAPKLTITNGFVFFPHPVDQTRIEIQAANVQWRLDGFPTGTLALATDVNLFDAGGFTLTLLGAPGAQTTGLQILAPAGGATLPSLRFFGQLRGLFDNTLLVREAGSPALEGIPVGQFGTLAAGELTVHAPIGNALPVVEFALADVGILGNFRLGGPNGVRVTGLTAGSQASIHLSGLGNLFDLADVPGRQFIVTLNGKIVQEGLPGFGVGNAKFIFFSPTQPPRFVPDTLVYDGSSWTLAQQLPVELRTASLRFLNGTLPLAQLLQPQNLEITSTFRLGFPSVEEPVFGGGADNVRMTFLADGTPQLQNLEGIELTLDPGIKIPPVEEIGGKIYITGLSNPANLLIAGRIGGSVNGYKLKFIGAFRSTGPLGIAVDFNAGSAGIPLGPTGFLFTGAGGGVSFLNTSADPMDIRSYVQEAAGKFQANPTNPPPAATMNWTGFKEWRDKILAQTPIFPPIGTGPALEVIEPGTYPANDPIGCPIDIPPASANILAMPHPDQAQFPGSYVLKFSSIPEDTLNKPIANGGMGITRDSIASLGQSGATLAATLATQIRQQIDATTPDVPAILGSGAQQAATELLQKIQDGFASQFQQALAGLPINATADQIYAAIRDKAHAGVPVQDATFAVKGVFTHAAISSFMNIEGGGTIGTTGSAGVTGRVNFLGLPVGSGKLFLSATDVNGNPNPQLTGDISMALGPLEIGSTKAALKAEGAVTGLAAVVGQIATTLGQAFVDQVLAEVNPDYVGMTLAQAQAAVTEGVPIAEQANRLAAFHAAFMAQVLRKPPGTLPDALIGQIASLLDQVNPELVICSDASIKLAGLKLSNGLAGMQFRVRKTGREAYFDIAPAGFIGYGTPIAALTSGIDRASMAYAETFPDATGLAKRLLNGKISSPAAIEQEARYQIASMLENSTITGTYTVNPLGMTLFRAQARLINPDLTAHPVVRNNNASPTDNWIRPGTGTLSALPTREALLLQTVRKNALGNVFWKGTDLVALYDGNAPALQGKTLTHDYFPHGGLAMAAMLDVPRILTTLPRTQWATLVNQQGDPLGRLEALRSIMRDYFGSTEQQGNFMAYVPLPNPPALFQGNGTPIIPPPSLDPYDLVNSLKTFNPDSIYPGTLWDLGESFAFLNLEGQILDIPIGTANLTAVGPNQSTGAPAMFTGIVKFAQGSWMELLCGFGVDVTAKIAGQARPERRPLAEAFAELAALDTLGPTPSQAAAAAVINNLANAAATTVAMDLPRVEVNATISTFTPPGGWGWLGEIVPIGSFTLSGYTPEFLPTLPPTPTDLQRLQKTGGLAMSGDFKLGNLITTNGQVLLEPPTDTRPHPRAVANLSGQTLTLPAPFSAVTNASITFDTEASTFLSSSGQLSAAVNLTSQLGWAVTIPAGATATITNHSATFSFTSAGAAASVTVNYTNPLAPTFSFSGQLEFNPLITSAISIVPQSGSKLIVVINGATGSMTNARVVIGAPFDKFADLPALTVDPSLNFSAASILAPLNNVTVSGFTMNGLTWKVQRTGGVLSITDVQGSVMTSALGAGFSTSLSGSVSSNGTFTLTGTTSAQGSFANHGVSFVSAGASMTFTNTAMTLNGTVGGGLLATNLVNGTVTTMANVTMTLNTSAVSTISGTITASRASMGALEVRPVGVGGTFVLTLSAAGFEVPAGQLFFTPAGSTAIASVPSFTIPPLGAALPAMLLNQNIGIAGSFGGFALSGLTFQLQRTATFPATYRLNNVAFNAPVPTGFGGTFNVSGGSFDGLNSTVNLPITSLPALSVGRFSISNSSGTPTLTSTGISLPAPRLTCTDLGITSLTLPGAPLVMPQSGALTISSISAGNLSPSLGSLSGFSIGSANFGLSKSGSTMNLTGFTGTLTVPGFTASPVSLSGTVPSSGAISFTGTGISQLAAGSIQIKGPGGGSIASTFSSTGGLVFTAGSVDVANVFNAVANFASNVNLTVPASPSSNVIFASFTAAPNLRGFALGNSSLSLERTGGAIRLNVTGSLPLPGGPTLSSFNGTISSAGAVSLSTSLSNGDFYGFPVTSTFALANNTVLWTAIVSDTAPRAWWRMEESGSTTIISNSSSHAPSHNGITDSLTTRPTLQDPSGFSDGTGVSMRFDGVDDFYNVPDNANLEGGNAMSVACWFKVNQFTGGKSFHTLVAKGDDSWRLAQDGTNNYLSFDTNSATSLHVLRASTVAVNDGKWHHVVATYDGATKRIYIDGVLRAAEAWNETIRDSSYPVGIGHNPQAANRHWNGWIDELAFWNTALTPRQVHAMYSRGNGLSLTFSGNANLRGSGGIVSQEFRPGFAGEITSSGEFDLGAYNLSASLLGFGFSDIDLIFQRRMLPSSTATISGAATLNALTGTPLSVNPRFQATFTRSGSNIVATLSAENQTMNFGGYAPAAGGFDLAMSGNLGTTRLLNFSDFRFGHASLAGLGLPALSGTMVNDGFFAIDSPILDSITLSGFNAPSCGVDFTRDGLYIFGSFNLSVTSGGFTRSFGNITLDGTVSPTGGYTLTGSGSLQIGNYSTDSVSLSLNSSNGRLTASADPNLNFGDLDVPVDDLILTSTSFSASIRKDFGPIVAKHLADHLETRFSGSTTLAFSFATGALTGSVSGTWAWEVKDFSPPGGYNPSGSYSISGGISDTGSFTVNNGSASGDHFFAPFWPNGSFNFAPPPGWLWGSWSSEPYELW